MKKLAPVFIFLTMINCNFSNECRYSLSDNTYYDKNHNLVTENWTVNDTSKFGREFRYYKNGLVSTITLYEFDSMQGIEEFYDTLGLLTSMVYWDNLNKSGPLFEFNKNGSMKIYFTYKDNFPIGNGYVYDFLGGLSRYIYFAEFGRAMFIVDYGIEKDSLSGSAIIHIKNIQENNTTDSLNFLIQTASPPGFSKYLIFQEFYNSEFANIDTINITGKDEIFVHKKLSKFNEGKNQIILVLISERTQLRYKFKQTIP